MMGFHSGLQSGRHHAAASAARRAPNTPSEPLAPTSLCGARAADPERLRVCPGIHERRAKRRINSMAEAAYRKALAEARVTSGSFQSRRLRLIQAKNLS